MSSASASVSSDSLGDGTRDTTLVLVTGSRTWPRADSIWDRLDALQVERGHLTIIHGAAIRGVDLFAHIWADQHERLYRDAKEWPFPADWASLGRKAGMVRNEEMVKVGPGYCLAWIQECLLENCRRPRPHGSHGASDCVAKARTYGVPIIELVEAWTQVAVPDPDLI